MEWEKRWEKPQEVSQIDLAFPARGLELAPTREQCRVAMDEWDDATADAIYGFGDAVFTWIAFGGPPITTMYMKDGIDGETAWRHLQVVAGCYGFKHEHKIDALNYLAWRWMDGYEMAKPDQASSESD